MQPSEWYSEQRTWANNDAAPILQTLNIAASAALLRAHLSYGADNACFSI